jgi:hypothetical protein
MKIEQLLVQHFYNCREITLQGMGTFTLSPDFVMPKENDKDAVIPEHVISFQYNSRATEDEALISFIVQQTNKMKALASADLDSYLVLGKQFLNIGKPFEIEGMGMLLKNQLGDLEFTKGSVFQSKLENSPAAVKEKKENPEISFASESNPANSNKKGLIIAAFIIGLGLIGTAIWYFLQKNNKADMVTTMPVLNTDTTKKITPNIDSVAIMPTIAADTTDGYTFKIVFMVTKDSSAAISRMNILTARNHKIIMYKKDSLIYKLAEPFTLPLSDTTRIKDSLNSFYYSGKGFIELK